MSAQNNRKILQQLSPLMNLGIELVVIIGVMGFIGWYIDNSFRTSPVWLVVFLVIGAVGGMYRFIRIALKASTQKTDKEDN